MSEPEPSEAVIRQLWQKAQMLGRGIVHVHSRHAGFDRAGSLLAAASEAVSR